VKWDLTTNTLTPGIVPSAVIKLVATSGTTCNASSVSAANLASGMVAWGTTFHALPGGGFGITETRFSNEGLSAAELARITSFCGFIQSDGSGFGICSSCKPGGQGPFTSKRVRRHSKRFQDLLARLKNQIRTTQLRGAVAVNQGLVLLYGGSVQKF
jgi:hypothetical protein